MIGKKIFDPYNVESGMRKVEGMGFLDTVTTFDRTKTTCQVEAYKTGASGQWSVVSEKPLKGYEIHMGVTTGDVGMFRLRRYSSNAERITHNSELIPDGSAKDNVWGTYIHGVFDNDEFRTAVINSLRDRKGLPPRDVEVNYQVKREEAINRWADTLKNSVDICFILRQTGMEYCMKR